MTFNRIITAFWLVYTQPRFTVRTDLELNMKDTNETAEYDHDSMPLGGFQAFTDIPPLTIGLLSFLTNVFVIRVILSKRSLRTSSNMILVSLGVSDLLTGLVTVPLTITCSVTLNTGVCITTAIFTKFISISTIVHISMITIDWHMFIVRALRYYEIVRKRYVVIVLVVSWLVISFLALVRLSWTLDANLTGDDEIQNEEDLFNYFCLGLFCALFVVNIVLDSHMLIILNRQVNKIIKHNLTRECLEHENRMRSNKRRAVVTCVMMLAINVILWLPYFSYDLWQEAWPYIPLAAEYVIINVRILSSLFNPIIYSIGQRTLRKAIQEKLRFKLPCKQTDEFKTEEIPLNQLT